MSVDGQGTKRRRNIVENFNWLSRVHERYRQTTDSQTTNGRATAYSESERESLKRWGSFWPTLQKHLNMSSNFFT